MGPPIEIAAGTQAAIPLNHDRNLVSFALEESSTQSDPQVQGASVTPEYFHLLGMPLLLGRLFTEFDVEKAPRVAAVNEAFARTWWPDEDPLGKRCWPVAHTKRLTRILLRALLCF
jgi:hypothetical protein